MDDITLIDDYGRRTLFTGELLVEEHTDTGDGLKPQWAEMSVWRTEGGNYVVQRTTCYRIRHTNPNCRRAEGYTLVEPTEDDTYPCKECNTDMVLVGGYAQDDRVTVDPYQGAQELINGFKTEGRFNNLARSVLADIAEKDEKVDALWNTVFVP